MQLKYFRAQQRSRDRSGRVSLHLLQAALALGGLGLLGGSGCAAAPPEPVKNQPSAPQEREPLPLDARIDLDFEDTSLSDVMDYVSEVVRCHILVDPNVRESVTTSLHQIPWREAVDVIAKMTNCTVEERTNGVLLLTQPARVTVQDGVGANARTILHLLASYRGQTIDSPRSAHVRDRPEIASGRRRTRGLRLGL